MSKYFQIVIVLLYVLLTIFAFQTVLVAGGFRYPLYIQWLVVLGLSLVMPAAVGVDKVIQLHRQRNAPSGLSWVVPLTPHTSPAAHETKQ